MALSTKFSIVLSLVLILSCTTAPKTPPLQNAEDPKYVALREKIQKLQSTYNIPGLQAMIFERHESPFKFAGGNKPQSGEAEAVAITEQDRFSLGTGTRNITAALIGQMIDQRLIDWDTPIGKLLPKDIKISGALAAITIEMLMGHRSGLIDVHKTKVWPTLKDSKYSVKRARELLVQSILSYNPQFTPGSKTQYSASDYIVLGYALENMTNFSFEDLVKNKIFSPLGMNSCAFETPIDGTAAAAPAGNIFCSATEWSRFLKEINLGLFQESFLMREPIFQKLLDFSKEPPHTNSAFKRYDKMWAGGVTLTVSSVNGSGVALAALAPSREISLIVLTNSGSSEAQEGAAKILKLLTETVQ